MMLTRTLTNLRVNTFHRIVKYVKFRSLTTNNSPVISKKPYPVFLRSATMWPSQWQLPSNITQLAGPTELLVRNVRWRSTGGFSEEDVVCYSELKELTQSGKVVFIDVRGKDETLRSGTIPGSICIPLPELESALKMSEQSFHQAYCREKPTTDDLIIFVCRKGERSFKALKQARKMGFEKSKTYQGGFTNWFNHERIKREKKPE